MAMLSLLLLFVITGTSVTALIDCQQQGASIPSTSALNETCRLLIENFNKYDVIFGPHHHDSHLAYFLIALYRMGASTERIREAYAYEVQDLNPAIPSQHVINGDTWQTYLRKGLYYKDYTEFIRAEKNEHGFSNMLELYAPTALEGLTGGLLHPLIQFGYGFELADEEIISEGVAWLLSHGDRFPKLNPNPKYTYVDAVDILAAMRSDGRFPTQNLSLDNLRENYADVLSEYDIQMPLEDMPSESVAMSLQKAAMHIFGSSCNNFFLLHLSTGSRALYQILPHISAAEVRSAALQQLWKGVVYVYALEGRPPIQPPKTGPLRSWADLIAAALPINDSHFQKMVYLCHENFKLDGDRMWWSVAENVVSLFEHGGGWVFQSAVAPADLRRKPAQDKVLFM